jgi:hypothetical protein
MVEYIKHNQQTHFFLQGRSIKLYFMNKIIITLLLVATIVAIGALNGCAAGKATQSAKTGSQLWSENCGRCHNAPSGSVYSADQWEVLVMHMKTRTMIPDADCQKILGFLQGK